ncbi:DotH/IcmK family type IV secretion protein [Cereibacter sphaeroides]|uniref:DotH/IcmK family type IV secretion protein n=1 Tax=Cereibacter sphaeroides TaxID=1063 RepID=UPI001F2F63CC|nr:DotH/IcmK family type IV secretion protein [Cereibacter sphaeroides]MCE6959651.1 DotH/IcmK family type IV secretion protein [Cereibacter sphaeroides]MCE6974488.1 DotH/IcmK family type IV secretion protein [Cereibacter sphaeroides]
MSTGGTGATAKVRGDAPAGLATGHENTPERVEGFNGAVEKAFPMTPEMITRYRQIFDETERAVLERPEPTARIDAGFIALEPGEAPPEVMLAPGIASVIGIYDATGQAWPITQFVVGNGDSFEVIQLGEDSNNIAITPLVRMGWSNLVLSLKGEPKPIVMRVGISETAAHYRQDIQVLKPGPNAKVNTAANTETVTEAGSKLLLAALSGVDLPANAKPVVIEGVSARGWLVNDHLFLRSRHALIGPSWLSSMSGPDGIRVYELDPTPVANFSVDGAIVRADVKLP